MPGPSIEVCKGDTVVVDVENHLLGESNQYGNFNWNSLESKYLMKLNN